MAAAASPSSCGGAPETSIPPGVSMCGRDRWGSSTAKKKKEKYGHLRRKQNIQETLRLAYISLPLSSSMLK